MMDWLKKKFLFGWLKSALDKLPFDGWKTISGVLIICLGVMLKALPQHAPYIQLVIDLLNYVGADPITDMGVVTLLTGITHKLLKAFGKE